MTIYRFFLLGSKLAPLLPPALGNGLCNMVGLLVYLLAPKRRRVLLCNLSHILAHQSLAERKRIARLIFQCNMRRYYDLLRTHKIPLSKLAQMVTVTGTTQMKALAAQNGNKGIILVSGHVGSFSLGPQVSTANDVTFYLLVEPIKPPELFELVRKLRSVDSRARTISVSSSEMRQIFRVLKEPDSLLCFALDRDVIGNGTPLTFFGAKAKLPTGAAEIALRTGALVVPLHVYDYGQNYYIDFLHERAFVAQSTGDKAADVERVAEQMLTEVEKIILATPEQWVALQPIWPDCE